MRAVDLSTIVLTDGSHKRRVQGMCAMEAVAWLAGEKHSDAPSCACPVITRYVQRINDARWSSDAARTAALVPWLACGSSEAPRPCILGSRVGPATELARARWLAHRALTWWAPLAGMSAVMRIESRGHDCTEMRAAYLALLESPSRETARRARDAAYAPYAAAYAPYAAAYAADAADAAAYADAARDEVLLMAVADLGPLLAIVAQEGV